MVSILIEPLRYTKRGLLYRTSHVDPPFQTICEETYLPVLDSCRTLSNQGSTGEFATYRKDIPYPCMVGDIEKASKLTVNETWFRKRTSK